MPNRTIIRTETHHPTAGPKQIIFMLEEAQNVLNSGGSHQLTIDLTAAPFSDLRSIPSAQNGPIANNLVKTAGEKITNALFVHQGVRQAIDASVANAGADPSPIYIHLRDIGAEAVPWELLYHQQGHFLSLDDRWPIVRLCGNTSPNTLLTYKKHLRITLIVSASKQSPMPEWDNFYRALTDSGLPYQLNVFVADDALKIHIESLNDASTSVEFVPADAEDLTDRLKALRPQIMHFFCHGSADSGGYLEIAGRDGGIGLDEAPLQLSAKYFRDFREHLWLVSLNACEGATPTHNMHSMAYDIVLEGIPAVIGMREAIDALDANVFCGSFYQSAFKWLASELSKNKPVVLDWTPMLKRARLKMLTSENAGNGGPQARAERSKSWSMPILYQQPDPARIIAVGDSSLSDEEIADLVVELESFRQMRAGLPMGTPRGLLDKLDAEITALSNKLSVSASGTPN